MKIKVLYKSQPDKIYAKIGKEDALEAMRNLSADAFKLWIELALNQYGFRANIEDTKSLEELDRAGYLMYSADNELSFSTDTTNKKSLNPIWKDISSLYGIAVNWEDYAYFRDKLITGELESKETEILCYWKESIDFLREYDHTNTTKPIRFDIPILLNQWLWKNFRFEIDDELNVGSGCSALRFHNPEAELKITKFFHDSKRTSVKMNTTNTPNWNRRYSECAFEIPLIEVGNILRARKEKHDVSF